MFELNGVHLNKKYELYRQDIISINDISDNFKLPQSAKIQVDVFKNGKELIDTEGIKNFLRDINYPFYFIDFETFQPAVPMFDNSRSYMQIPFQYSIHFLQNKEAKLIHYDFPADATGYPRIRFIENLLRDLDEKGDILVYNKSFEIKRLNEIAEAFPQYREQINKVILRIKDLIIPFQQKYYYTNDMKGSYSIKYVLPALMPELNYDNLEIYEGALASLTFESLYGETSPEIINQKRKNLLEYCKLDTLAIVKILEKQENTL